MNKVENVVMVTQKRKNKHDPIPARFDEYSGLMQRTLKNGNTVSVLFGSLAKPVIGKKGLYMDLPSNLENVVLPMAVNDGFDTYSGVIKIGEYNVEHGMYETTFIVGESKKTKMIKVHDLATLWCVVGTSIAVLNKEKKRINDEMEENAKMSA